MNTTVQVAGINLLLPEGTRSTVTTPDDGDITYRFFIDPIIILAVGAVPVADESALDVAASIRANYVATSKFRRESFSPQPEAGADGVDRGLLRFRWSSSTGEEQASRILVLRRGAQAVALNATCPAARIEELHLQIEELLASAAFALPAAD